MSGLENFVLFIIIFIFNKKSL